jgi:CspA family cold shock protein
MLAEANMVLARGTRKRNKHEGFGWACCQDKNPPSNRKEDEVVRGTVKWFDDKKGYGFITEEGTERDVFVHYSSIETEGYKSLEKDDEVEFRAEKTDKEWQAFEVRPSDIT